MAPEVGFEPTTKKLTAACSTSELRWLKSSIAQINRLDYILPSKILLTLTQGYASIKSYASRGRTSQVFIQKGHVVNHWCL
jgi:hypothetical protein